MAIAPRLPEWLNPEQKPHDDMAAQAVWVFRMWFYIPFSDGLPLRPLCATLNAAHGVVRFYEDDRRHRQSWVKAFYAAGHAAIAEQAADAIMEWEAASRMICYDHVTDVVIPEGYKVVQLTDHPDSHVVVGPDGLVALRNAGSFEAAVTGSHTRANQP